MNLTLVTVEKPADMNFVLGQAHFIKTVDDIYEAIVQANPGMKFGVAFCEASGPALVRSAGNDPALVALARKNALAIGAGHQAPEGQRSGGQLEGCGRMPMKQPRRFAHRPNIRSGRSPVQEKIVAAVRHPRATALAGLVMPSWQYGMKITAV